MAYLRPCIVAIYSVNYVIIRHQHQWHISCGRWIHVRFCNEVSRLALAWRSVLSAGWPQPDWGYNSSSSILEAPPPLTTTPESNRKHTSYITEYIFYNENMNVAVLEYYKAVLLRQMSSNFKPLYHWMIIWRCCCCCSSSSGSPGAPGGPSSSSSRHVNYMFT